MKSFLLFFFFAAIIFISCNSSQKENTASNEAVIDSQAIKKDSTASVPEKTDTLMKTSFVFEINKLKYYWKIYLALNETGKGGESILELIDDSTQKILITEKDYYDLNQFDAFDFNSTSFIDSRDLNFDGFKDLAIYNKSSSGSGGEVYNVYLFNKKTKSFNPLKDLSGANIQTDSIHKTLTSTWRMGLGWEQSQTQHFNSNGEIKFTETFTREMIEEDRIKTTYKKLIKSKVVLSKIDTNDNNEY